jgi:hypothetical protein
MRARPYFACERSVGVLVVFELDHRVILLEPFKTLHKGNFARSSAFALLLCVGVNQGEHYAAVQHETALHFDPLQERGRPLFAASHQRVQAVRNRAL